MRQHDSTSLLSDPAVQQLHTWESGTQRGPRDGVPITARGKRRLGESARRHRETRDRQPPVLIPTDPQSRQPAFCRGYWREAMCSKKICSRSECTWLWTNARHCDGWCEPSGGRRTQSREQETPAAQAHCPGQALWAAAPGSVPSLQSWNVLS